ncbi:hypothetical protein L596_007562 [Steinernema carpocapsae]|uniref:Uncharacterized protein n=1 Tax=Steinernema carpocapsae TaxID=34508 RepID=A0A4U5P9Q3_STECR|nr:hypothetical protein L596_007562 [Steinernema carpocapsae]
MRRRGCIGIASSATAVTRCAAGDGGRRCAERKDDDLSKNGGVLITLTVSGSRSGPPQVPNANFGFPAFQSLGDPFKG